MRRIVPIFLALLALTGCGGNSLPANPGSAAPANQAATAQGTLAAQTTAQTEFGLMAGGDYGHAWDLWSDAAKQSIARADFITLNTSCPEQLGAMTKIVTTRPVNNSTVAIDWQRAAHTGTVQMVYAAGAWRFEPAAQEYQGSLKALTAKRRAAHLCRKAS